MSSDSSYETSSDSDSDSQRSPSHPPASASPSHPNNVPSTTNDRSSSSSPSPATSTSSNTTTSSSSSSSYGSRPPGPLLSIDLLNSVAGNCDLEVLEDVEIIFSPVAEISNLNRCVNLRSLTLIAVGLRRLSNLACCGRSLERLCLPENEITKMEGLYLPNLRELYLQSNQIGRIEGLDGCPKLQRLWLTDNRIVKMEHLSGLGDLRELWLQGNRIHRIQNIEHLANLESLQLSNNRIADFKDLSNLSHLPNLRELSLDDPDHGSNPVVRADGYRHFILCTLKSVRSLDGITITSRARSNAEELYVERVLAFNDRVDQVRRDNERELLAIEARKQRNMANADGLRDELQRAFRELETTVREGRNRIDSEQTKQLKVRVSNLSNLKNVLNIIRKEHSDEINHLVMNESLRMKSENAWFISERCKMYAVRNAALFLAKCRPVPELKSGNGGGAKSPGSSTAMTGLNTNNPSIACQDLSEHVPDYRFLSAHFRAASNGGKSNTRSSNAAQTAAAQQSAALAGNVNQLNKGGSGGETTLRKLRILKVYKMYNGALHNLSERATGTSPHSKPVQSSVDGGTTAWDAERLYVGGSLRQLQHVALHGFSSWPECNRTLNGQMTSDKTKDWGNDPNAPIVLYTDPMLAVEASARAASRTSSQQDQEKEENFSVGAHAVHTVLLCRLDLGRRHTMYGSRSQALQPSKELAAQIPPECHTGMVSYSNHGKSDAGGGTAGAFYIVRREHAYRIVPECYLLAQESPRVWPGTTKDDKKKGLDGAKIEKVLAELTMPAHQSLIGKEAKRITSMFDKRVLKEVQRYEHRIYQEMDPETAEQLQQSENEVSRLRDTLSGLRKQIDSEKGMQERILREFRASFGDNGSGSNSSVRRSGSLAQAVANNRPSSGSRRSHEKY